MAWTLSEVTNYTNASHESIRHAFRKDNYLICTGRYSDTPFNTQIMVLDINSSTGALSFNNIYQMPGTGDVGVDQGAVLAGNILYLANHTGSPNQYRQVLAFDVTDPTNISFLDRYVTNITNSFESMTHDSSTNTLFVYENRTYGRLWVFDSSLNLLANPEDTRLYVADFQRSCASNNNGYVATVGSVSGRLVIWDGDPPASTSPVLEVAGITDTGSVTWIDNFIYASQYWANTVTIVDASTPTSASVVATMGIASGDATRCVHAYKNILVVGGNNNMSVYDITNRTSPVHQATLLPSYDPEFFDATWGGLIFGVPPAFTNSVVSYKLGNYTEPFNPIIYSVHPNAVSTSGYDDITITGEDLRGTVSVKADGIDVVSFTIDSDTQITAKVPPHPPGTGYVTVE